MGKLSKVYKLDRELQKKGWASEFFDSRIMKILGLSIGFIVFLLIIFAICVVTNHTYFADKIWDLSEKLILLVFGAMFSSIGMKVESTLR